MRSRSFAPVLLLAITTIGGASRPATAQLANPEPGSGLSEKALAVAERHMVSAANPLAAEAGLLMLRKGGTATDAAIATQLVLGLVEPQSSGLGGGAFIVHWDNAGKQLKTYDGRETAPAAARPDRFLRDGKPMDFDTAVHSGLSVGIPGLVRLLEEAHRKHGRLPWPDLFQPAIALAENGFEVSPRLSLLLRWYGARSFAPEARGYFFDGAGSPRPAGYRLKNPAYAATLRAIAAQGSRGFYEGPVAEAIVAAVQGAPTNPGDMTLADIAAYRVEERPPFCFVYRAREICGMGPPSSGGPAVAQTLMLVERFDLGRGREAAMSAQALHLIAEAEKLAYADRDRYLADPAFVQVPHGLTDKAYIASRRHLIDPNWAARTTPPPGVPPGAERQSRGIDATRESTGTSHISVVDGEGNAVAMTTTIEAGFGSRLMAAGFLLNNELTDFSMAPADAKGRPIANRVEPGKRPRSSMAPTIVFEGDRQVRAVLGSPGGSRIILYVVKTLVALIDWDMSAQEAAALTNFGGRGELFELEAGVTSMWYAFEVAPYGQRVKLDLMTSGTHVIVARDGKLHGGADPRREGTAIGD